MRDCALKRIKMKCLETSVWKNVGHDENEIPIMVDVTIRGDRVWAGMVGQTSITMLKILDIVFAVEHP